MGDSDEKGACEGSYSQTLNGLHIDMLDLGDILGFGGYLGIWGYFGIFLNVLG